MFLDICPVKLEKKILLLRKITKKQNKILKKKPFLRH